MPCPMTHHKVEEAELALGHALLAAVKEGADGQARCGLLVTLAEKLLLEESDPPGQGREGGEGLGSSKV